MRLLAHLWIQHTFSTSVERTFHTILFHTYLSIGLERTVLFTDGEKVDDEVKGYLQNLSVERKEYNDLWNFLRCREWGEGKVGPFARLSFFLSGTDSQILISPQTSYAISLMLTHFRYTVVPPILDEIMAIKNSVELDGLRQAYLVTIDSPSYKIRYWSGV
jgi:Xaa-Pro aminopeptidase